MRCWTRRKYENGNKERIQELYQKQNPQDLMEDWLWGTVRSEGRREWQGGARASSLGSQEDGGAMTPPSALARRGEKQIGEEIMSSV